MRQRTGLIAPCGMNCGICRGYLRDPDRCPGCHGDDADKPKYCVSCIIANCQTVLRSPSGFCFECDRYPCKRLRALDKRYRTRYAMSMIENLENIRRAGLEKFLESERLRWRCQQCGGTICVHTGSCYACGARAAGAVID